MLHDRVFDSHISSVVIVVLILADLFYLFQLLVESLHSGLVLLVSLNLADDLVDEVLEPALSLLLEVILYQCPVDVAVILKCVESLCVHFEETFD